MADENGYTRVYPNDMLCAMSKSKDVGLRIRVEKDLRQAFADACRGQDMAASEVLREFMRLYSAQQQNGMQKSLFPLIDKNSTIHTEGKK